MGLNLISSQVYCSWKVNKTNYLLFNETVLGVSLKGHLFSRADEAYYFIVDVNSFNSLNEIRDQKLSEILVSHTMTNEQLKLIHADLTPVENSSHFLVLQWQESQLNLLTPQTKYDLTTHLQINKNEHFNEVIVNTTLSYLNIPSLKFLFGLGSYVHDQLDLTMKLETLNSKLGLKPLARH